MKRVGFDRLVRLEWLDKTVELVEKGLDNKKIKDELKNYIMIDLDSKENTRKTINILIRTWSNVLDRDSILKGKAISLWSRSDADAKVVVHWGMLLLAYPIFVDITTIIGKVFSMQDEFRLSYIRNRIYDLWGERSTVKYSVDKIISTITQWGILEKSNKPGKYLKVEPMRLDDRDIVLFLIECYLRAANKDYINFSEVFSLDCLFPFKIELGLDDICNYPGLNINRLGSDTVITSVDMKDI